MTKLASALPKGEANGLAVLSRSLIDTPEQVHIAVILVDCKSINTDMDSGDITPTARIRRIEVISEADKAFVSKMMRRALEKRTGKTVLPFDLEEDMRAAFGNVDPTTGEILD